MPISNTTTVFPLCVRCEPRKPAFSLPVLVGSLCASLLLAAPALADATTESAAGGVLWSPSVSPGFIAPSDRPLLLLASDWDALFSPSSDGTVSSLFVPLVPGAGPLTLYGVTAEAGKLVGIQGGKGTLYVAGKVGVDYGLKNVRVGPDWFAATVFLTLPAFLKGGADAELDVRFSRARGLEADGFYISVPGPIEKGAFSMEKVILEVRPSKGTYAGGGLFAIGKDKERVGGWLEVDMTLGTHGDVTLIGFGKGNLNSPIGSSGAFLQEFDGKLENKKGLGNPANWLQSRFKGHFEITAGPKIDIPVMGETDALSVEGEALWNPADASFTLDGEGKLLGLLPLATLKAAYAPPFRLHVTGSVSGELSMVFAAKAALDTAPGNVSGSLSGDLRIPSDVAVIGGLKLAKASATFSGTSLHGSASIKVAHGVDRVCHQVCHKVCHSACSWIPWVGDVCESICKTACNTVCDTVTHFADVPFDFSFDVGSGKFSFLPRAPWLLAAPLPGADGVAAASLDLPPGAPSVFFRAVYGGSGVTRVDMTVTTPSGMVLRSAEGPLPGGFPEVRGFSRFNPEAREQVIALSEPAPGLYTVAVANASALGGVSFEMLVPGVVRSAAITSISRGRNPGEYSISWSAKDPDGVRVVRLLLTPDRSVDSGLLAGEETASDPFASSGSMRIDTTSLRANAGWYWVILEAEDGTGATLRDLSEEPILVSPASAPLPPESLAATAGDGSVSLTWVPGASAGAVGSRVLWTRNHVSLGPFEGSAFVPAGENAYRIDGLGNGEPILVTVVAVLADGAESVPADVLRVVPLSADGRNAPEITSLPDDDATAGFPYSYVPHARWHDAAGDSAWNLEEGPAGMTVDALSGTVEWTPAVSQAGRHDVRLRLSRAGGPSTASVVQAYSLFVYGPELANGLEEHPCRFDGPPLLDATAGSRYTSRVTLSGPGCDTEGWHRQPLQPLFDGDPGRTVLPASPETGIAQPVFRLLAGPEGMTVQPRNGFVAWNVPAGAKGHSVSIEVEVESGPAMRLDYYLAVSPSSAPAPAAETGKAHTSHR